jgi:Skp family chaperone for outer membrane proteins
MKKYFLLLLACFPLLTVNAQTKGVKIAYIDMNYILDKVPDYADAKNQLEMKAQKWKQEIEVKKNDINKLKESLKAEKALLTKELIEEREEEIKFLENDLLDYQEKRFGPKGDLVTQKAVLVKPIQDQVFTVVQDVADQRKYDFVFDKSSDLTMLFAAQRHDISELVIRRLTRAAKTKQLSAKELKKLEEEEAQQDQLDDPEYQERQKALDDKKAERERKLAERKALQEQKRQEFQERREQLKRDREAKKTGTAPTTNAPATSPDGTDEGTPAGNTNRPGATTNSNPNNRNTVEGENAKEVKTTATDTPEEGEPETVNRQTAAQQAQEERARKIEERRKANEEKRQKMIAEREAAKKAREEQKNNNNNTNNENKDE